MKAATYARYSTEHQNDASTEDQQRECDRIASRHGYEIVGRYNDAAVSGGTAARPEYQRMLDDARHGKFDAIIAEDLSRLWRNLAEQSRQLAELADIGVVVITLDVDTRAESAELLSAMHGAMNSMYRKEISRRTRRGLEGRALAGQPTGGRCYGYPTPNHAATNEPQTVQTIFSWRADGLSLSKIARRLNGLDIPGPKGGMWGPSTIHAILTNQRYTGAIVYGRLARHRSAVDSRRVRRVARVGGPLVLRQDESQRIISDELWNRSR
jgi:site-specific DNA recombinase